ncbi:Helicase conserved C-terminal domain-containing protein [Nocardioides scoriae]|uniref:Helicase conserved C-terminal domain-containing protein n=1 Tax=Nocardioides scoriae TaxID=642780 RepID=A0A1H1TLR3_9ACTN|nr:Helicase conserved C-terminal domain-containing protein [Nocardioides scoriae]
MVAAQRAGSDRWWVTLPPGAGKTLVGTEVARLRGRRTVVLSPNTAVQGQWARTWEAYDGPPPGTRRDLRTGFATLTYQSLAVFEGSDGEGDLDRPERPDAEAGDAERPGAAPTSHLDRLHPHGRELVETMREAGPLLLVLDECHHLLEVWGELLREVLAELPDAQVLGLTATPPEAMTAAQATLTAELFGPVLHEARIPALVKAGALAPYAELAWLVEPTPDESDWLAAQATRFAELTADLFDPAFGSTTLPVWLQQRFAVDEAAQVGWAEHAAREPALTDAVLRLAHHDLLPLPEGAVLRERHRERPGPDDWRLLMDDWLRGCIQPRAEGDGEHADGDRAVLEAVRRTLPSIGLAWTRHGVRPGRGTVDRVTARSRAKEQAAAAIVGAEGASSGERARVLVLCDHERATATTRRRLSDGPSEELASSRTPEPAGSATGVLTTLLADPASAALDPVLVTGRTVAGSEETLHRLVEWLRRSHPMLAGGMSVDLEGEVPRLVGRWSSGQWVAHLTRWFDEGGTRCLIGTRGLLGEGWDAPCVSTLVDLTTVTTPTSVVQTRGRALRTDPSDPDKVALVWSVVCVYDGHVAGAADWQRFTRKHRGYFTVDEHGAVVDGVAGLDSSFSEHHPPPREDFDALDARMLQRAQDRAAVREAWLARPDHDDRVGHVLRLRRAAGSPGAPAATTDGTTGLVPWTEAATRRPGATLAVVPPVVALALVGLLVVLGLPVALLVVLAVLLLGAAATLSVALWGRAVLRGASEHHFGLGLVAAAVADALHAAGQTPVGARALRIEVAPDATESYRLVGVDEAASARFAEALEEVCSPMTSPRYVIARTLTSPPTGLDGLLRGLRAHGGQQPDGEVWHTVPSALAGHRRTADLFAQAWGHWVGGGDALYVHLPGGAGVLATHRGQDPFAVTCVVRRVWT